MGSKNNPGKFDCYHNAHPDEPMFILLGRDPHAHLLVDRWADMREKERGPSAKVDEARACAEAMRAWQAKGAPTEVTVTINGKAAKLSPKGVTYEEIVALAGMTGMPSLTFCAEYIHGTYSGILCPGSATLIPSEGMIFRVAHTGGT